jgi:rhodanese-related sulfurtransferase
MTMSQHPAVRDVDVTEARRLIADGAFALDVREPAEWAEGHLAGSTLVPLGSLAADSVPQGRTVVVICRSGARSAAAAGALQAAGHRDVVNLAGGVLAWAGAGYPLVTDEVDPR